VVSSSASYTFTASANRTLVANFSLVPCTYIIAATSSPLLGGTTSGGGTVNCNSTVTMTAAAASGYSFVNWTENGNSVSTSAIYAFTVTSSRSLVANFTTSSSSTPGQVLWAKAVGAASADHSYAVASDINGNVFVGGDTSISGSAPFACLTKFSAVGDVLW